MSTESMVTQADRDLLEEIKNVYWPMASDDKALAVIARRREAAQPEREDVLPPFTEAWAKKEVAGYRYGGDALENVEFGYKIAREELAALTTPAPAVSTDEIVVALEEATAAIDQLERSVRFLTPENVRPDTSNARALVERARALLSRLRGESPMPEEAVERAHDHRASEAQDD